MAIFYDYIKGVNAHQIGEKEVETKIVFNKNARPSIIVNNIDYGSIITKNGDEQEINTDLRILNGHTVYGNVESSNANIINTLNINANATLTLLGDITVNGPTSLEISHQNNEFVIFSNMITESLELQHKDEGETIPKNIFTVSKDNILFNKPLRVSELVFITIPEEEV